jgi:hypothetical protein
MVMPSGPGNQNNIGLQEVASSLKFKSFDTLGVVASIVSIIGWIAVVIGAVVIFTALSDGFSYEARAILAGGIPVFFGGAAMILVAGVVKVLIAIEGHLKPKS